MALSLSDLRLINIADTNYVALLKAAYELEMEYRKLSWAKRRAKYNKEEYNDIIKEIDIIKNNWRKVQDIAYTDSMLCSYFFQTKLLQNK